MSFETRTATRRISRPGLTSSIDRKVKRAMDIAGSSFGLLLTSPLLAFVAWRISREPDHRTILFKQTRLGQDMQPFTMLKFRSLVDGTDSDAHQAFIAAAMRGDCADDETRLVHKLDYGQQVTRTGRWIRRTSVDELPQLVNVLRGEMSLVGPRPCIPYEVAHMKPHHLQRFDVAAGMTGLWQVQARGRVSFAEALEFDVTYVATRSLMLDLKLLLKTLVTVFRTDRRTG